MLKKYDIDIVYHPRKANMIVDAYIHLYMGNLSHMEEFKKEMTKDIHRLESWLLLRWV